MAIKAIFYVLLWTTLHITATGNFYFVSQEPYAYSALDYSIVSSTNLAGNVDTVTQQCRRSCAHDVFCKAYEVTLLEAAISLEIFSCSFYELRACNYSFNSLQNTSSTPHHRLWEKLDADSVNPKPCIEYCIARARGYCSICGGLRNFTGLVCTLPPMLCSDYNMVDTTADQWPPYLIWPWGPGGRNLTVFCRNRATLMVKNIRTLPSNPREVFSLGWSEPKYPADLSAFKAAIQAIDWRFISELQSLSTEKKLIVSVALVTNTILDYVFSGFRISPLGELSLIASLSTPSSTGYPTPLYEAPFVNEPLGSDATCGPFWRFNPDGAPVCDQRTKLFSFGNVKWDGITSTGLGNVTLSFK